MAVSDRWCILGYYTLNPYAPDGSDRLLAAGVDLSTSQVEVLILSNTGRVLDRFHGSTVFPSVWHTGLWQSWSPDARYVYFQRGALKHRTVVRRELATGRERVVSGELEGMPASGEPGIGCFHSMLYAAGYGDGIYKSDESPIPFQAREKHGLHWIGFEPPRYQLKLSTAALLEMHPHRDRLRDTDHQIKQRWGVDDGLTMMTYCIRWNAQGARFFLYFGNHSVVKERGEPKLSYVFTADRDLRNIRMVLDLSFDKAGVHWGWQADGNHLIGYGPRPDDPSKRCLAQIRFDGSGYRKLSDHCSGGHPSVCPTDPDLLVTDELVPGGGAVVFLSRRTGLEVGRVNLPKYIGDTEPSGRNPQRICHHPVFHPSGRKLLVNTLPGPLATLVQITLE